jgi:hypothetical protein
MSSTKYDNSNRKLVRICARAYMWVSDLDVLLVDKEQRFSYPLSSPNQSGSPGRFMIEFDGFLSIPAAADYLMFDAGPYEKFYVPEFLTPYTPYPSTRIWRLYVESYTNMSSTHADGVQWNYCLLVHLRATANSFHTSSNIPMLLFTNNVNHLTLLVGAELPPDMYDKSGIRNRLDFLRDNFGTSNAENYYFLNP